MDIFISKLGINKVNLDINTNEYEEKYEYNNIPSKFDEIEAIGSLYKELIKERIKDEFIYFVISYIDPLISLYKINKKNEEIDKYLNNLYKDIDLNLKKYGFTKRRIKKEDIIENKSLLYEYIARTLNISLVIEDKIYGCDDNCIILNNKFAIISNTNINDYKLNSYKEKILLYSKTDLKNLNVNELKDIAISIGIDYYKTVDNKKKPLLKSELKEKLSIILSSIRENGN
jgi:hypothetical protein